MAPAAGMGKGKRRYRRLRWVITGKGCSGLISACPLSGDEAWERLSSLRMITTRGCDTED